MSNQQRRIIVSRPGGLTVEEYKRRPKKTATENMASRNHFKNGSSVKFGWVKVQKTGLNTSGPLCGLRASSFNNPILGPPKGKSMRAIKKIPFRKLIHDKLKNVANIINNKSEGILSSCRKPNEHTSRPIGLCMIAIARPPHHNKA